MRFMKKIILFCISVILIYTAIQMYLSYRLNSEMSPTLTTCFYAFFGTELAACALIRIFDRTAEEWHIEDAKREREEFEKENKKNQ